MNKLVKILQYIPRHVYVCPFNRPSLIKYKQQEYSRNQRLGSYLRTLSLRRKASYTKKDT